LLTATQASDAASSTTARNERPSPSSVVLVFPEEPESSGDRSHQLKSLHMYHQHSDDTRFHSCWRCLLYHQASLLERISASAWADLLLSWLVRGSFLLGSCQMLFLHVYRKCLCVYMHSKNTDVLSPRNTGLCFCTQHCDLAQRLCFNVLKTLVKYPAGH